MAVLKLKYAIMLGLVLIIGAGVGVYSLPNYLDRLAVVKLDVSEDCNDFQLYKFYLPLAKDREYIPSSLYGYVNAVLGEKGISSMQNGDQLVALIEKFKSGDIESLYNSNVDRDVFQNKKSFTDFVNLYNGAFGEYKDFVYKGAVCMGEKKVVYWQIKTKTNQDFVRYFVFSYKNGEYLFSNRDTDSDLEPLFFKVFSEDTVSMFERDYLLEGVSKYNINIFNKSGRTFAKLMVPGAINVGKNIQGFIASGIGSDEEVIDISKSFFTKMMELNDPADDGLFTKYSHKDFLKTLKIQEDVDMARYKNVLSQQNLLYLLPAKPFILAAISNLQYGEINNNESIQLLYLVEENGAYKQTNFRVSGR